MMANETSALIQALGGAVHVAETFGVTVQAVSGWIADNEVPRAREARMLQLVARLERETKQRIAWRPRDWDPCMEIRYNPEADAPV
jgi:hypothetical protein